MIFKPKFLMSKSALMVKQYGKYFLIIFLILFWTCSSKNENSSNSIGEYDINTLNRINNSLSFVDKTNNNPISGNVYQLLESGEKVILGNLKNGKAEGLWIKLGDNGRKVEEGHYKKGLLRGHFILYYPSGSKSLEGSILHGKKNGLFAMYYENGVRSFRGEYFNGNGKGVWLFYNNDGSIKKKKDCEIEECIQITLEN